MPREWDTRLIIAAVFVVRFFIAIFWDITRSDNNASSTPFPPPSAALGECTEEESLWQKPDILSSVRYNNIIQAENILRFLIGKLNEVGAPVTLMYGTLLREHRNGTDGPCLRPDYYDKDFDIALFPEHFHIITTLKEEIYEKFGWVLRLTDHQVGRLFTSIHPEQANIGEYMSIDIYGFHCSGSNDLVYFPWDGVSIERNAMLPVVKHKLIPLQNNTIQFDGMDSVACNNTSNKPGFFKPYNVPCLLHNIYGPDYMVPKSGKESQAKWGTFNGKPAYYDPVCEYKLTPVEVYELRRQVLTFCSGSGYIPAHTRSKPWR